MIALKRGSILRVTRQFSVLEPITRDDADAPPADDDEWIVHGMVATEGLKADGLNLTYDALRGALPGFNQYPVGFASHSISARDAIMRIVSAEPREEVVNGTTVRGIYARGLVSRAEPGIWTKIRERILTAWSVGFAVDEWRERPDGFLDVTRLDLYDMSIVPIPLDKLAWASPARAAKAASASVVVAEEGVAAVAAAELAVSALYRLHSAVFG